MRTFFSDLIDRIIEIVMNFVTEVQVIWSENLNTVTNEKAAASAPPTIPVTARPVLKKTAEKVVKKVVEEVVNVVTAAPPVVENVAEIVQEVN